MQEARSRQGAGSAPGVGCVRVTLCDRPLSAPDDPYAPFCALVSAEWPARKTRRIDRYVTPLPRRACRSLRQAEVGPRWSAGLLFQGVQELPAGLLAAPAGLLADPAVLMVPGMPLALVAAALAVGHAGLPHRPGHVAV